MHHMNTTSRALPANSSPTLASRPLHERRPKSGNMSPGSVRSPCNPSTESTHDFDIAHTRSRVHSLAKDNIFGAESSGDRDKHSSIPSIVWRLPSARAKGEHMDMYVCIYMYVYICIHTHTHTHNANRLILGWLHLFFMLIRSENAGVLRRTT